MNRRKFGKIFAGIFGTAAAAKVASAKPFDIVDRVPGEHPFKTTLEVFDYTVYEDNPPVYPKTLSQYQSIEPSEGFVASDTRALFKNETGSVIRLSEHFHHTESTLLADGMSKFDWPAEIAEYIKHSPRLK